MLVVITWRYLENLSYRSVQGKLRNWTAQAGDTRQIKDLSVCVTHRDVRMRWSILDRWVKLVLRDGGSTLHLETRVLIAGGAGFLGSHLGERLLKQGANVICVDNYFTGTRRNIESMLDHHGFEVIRHDVTFPLYVEADQIYNLACPASPIHYQHDPVQTTKTSVHGAINMLGLAKRLRAKILQASTSEIYGDPNVHPQREDYWGHVNPIGPRSCYDEGKRCAETLFFDYWRQHKLPIKVARIFNTYGPRMHPNDGRVVSNFNSGIARP